MSGDTERLLKTYERELKQFEDWIEQNPRLPKNINKLLLLRYLNVYDFDLEAAKKLLVLNFETRKKHPEIFTNRDVLSDELQTAMRVCHNVGLRKNTKENHKITVFQLASSDTSEFILKDIVRLLCCNLDCRLVMCDENELINGEVSIVDMGKMTFWHLTKVISSMGILKAYASYEQEAAPIKIIETHFINCSSILYRFMSLIKPFLRKEVRDTLIFHASLDSLYECIPKDLLPVDFGGTSESLEETNVRNKRNLEMHREYLMCSDNWKIED